MGVGVVSARLRRVRRRSVLGREATSVNRSDEYATVVFFKELTVTDVKPTVFIVDDDRDIQASLRAMVESADLNAATFDSAQAFLSNFAADRHGCLILNATLPGMSGLDLLNQLRALGFTFPTIVIFDQADVATAVSHMRAGAIDFLQKPLVRDALIERVREAVEMDRALRRRRVQGELLDQLFSRLTPRECEVMSLVVQGKPNKEVAAILNRSEKTVEFHRAQVMKKMEVNSFAELVRLYHERACYGDGEQIASVRAPRSGNTLRSRRRENSTKGTPLERVG